MDIVKKNILSIIAGVVALLAFVAWIWPLGSMKQEAQNKLEERTQVYSKMQGLLTASRTLPVVALKGGEPQVLATFPTPKVIAWGQELTKKLADEAQNVKAIATAFNKRPLLVPDSLPVPAPTTEFRFRDDYRRYVEMFPKAVKAGTPPTQLDIDAAAKELWTNKFDPQIIRHNGMADPSSQQQVTAEFQKEAADLPESVKLERARTILFYMNPQAMDVSPTLLTATAAAPTPVVIWDAQVKIWIQNDVAQAIVDLNSRMSKTQSVVDAPVKQLIGIKVDAFRGAGAVTGGAAGMPGMMPGMPGMMPDMMMPDLAPGMGMPGMPGMPGGEGGTASVVNSPTGRTANALYDVAPFRLVVHVEADKLPQFLEELGRNRFITPWQVSLKAVDSVILSAATNVMYGPSPVVEATINCEALLLRDWTVPLMPREIRASLGLDAAGGAAGTAAPAGAPGMPGMPGM